MRSLDRASCSPGPPAGAQNYVDPELKSWQRAYYGSNYARLVDVKRRFDPDGLFRFPPAIGG